MSCSYAQYEEARSPRTPSATCCELCELTISGRQRGPAMNLSQYLITLQPRPDDHTEYVTVTAMNGWQAKQIAAEIAEITHHKVLNVGELKEGKLFTEEHWDNAHASEGTTETYEACSEAQNTSVARA